MDDKEEGADVIEDVGTFLDTTTDIPVKSEEVQETPPECEVDASNKVPSIRIQKDHPKDFIIGDPNSGVTTRSRGISSNSCFVSKVEPKNVKEALTDEYWITAMQEELEQFKRNEVWELVPRPEGTNIIGTKIPSGSTKTNLMRKE